MTKPARATYQILWARGCRDHTTTGADSMISGLCGVIYRLPVFRCGTGAGCVLAPLEFPRRVRSLRQARPVLSPDRSVANDNSLNGSKETTCWCSESNAKRPVRTLRHYAFQAAAWGRSVKDSTLGLSLSAASSRTNIEQRRGLCQEIPAAFEPTKPASKLKDSCFTTDYGGIARPVDRPLLRLTHA